MLQQLKKFLLNSLFIFLVISIIFGITTTFAASNDLRISFIDVGQADCILIQTPNLKNILVDAGNFENFAVIDTYIKQRHIERLDVVVATHPHADHIGSLAAIIRRYEITQIYMPKVAANTRTFEDLLGAIKEKGLKVDTARAGEIIAGDPDLEIAILAPNSQVYNDLNDYSVVLKITYGKTVFLLTGDSTKISETEMLEAGYDLKADVLKIGHHGSNSSSSTDFLKAVSPKYAVISAGKNNSYGHPGKYTLGRLNDLGIQVLRTDRDGTILIISDGETIRIDKSASPIKPNAPPLEQTSVSAQVQNNSQSEKISTIVYVTRTGKKYHRDGCRYLSRSRIPISLKEAKKSSYGPCSVCNPPR